VVERQFEVVERQVYVLEVTTFRPVPAEFNCKKSFGQVLPDSRVYAFIRCRLLLMLAT